MAAFPAIHCRCGIAFFTEPSLQALCAALCLRLLSTTAANPAIHCRCGTALFCRTLSTGLLSGIVPPLLFHNGSVSCDSLPLRHRLFCAPSLQAFCAALSFRSFSTTAAFPAILCRCGTAFSAAPSLWAFCAALSFRSFSTTAAKPVTCDSLPLRNIFFRRTLATGHLCRIVPPSLFHNGSISRNSLPLRHRIFCCPLATGSLRGIVPPSLFHNGSISRDSLPLRHRIFCRPLAIGSLCGIVLPLLFHNGSKTRDSLPLR